MSNTTCKNKKNWGSLAVLLMVSAPAPALAQTASGTASMNGNGLNFYVGGNTFTLGMNGSFTAPGAGAFSSTVTAPAIAISGISQPFDSARMNWVNMMYSMECANGEALTANGNGQYSCVQLSDLFSSVGGQLGTATLPDCPAGQLITSDGNNLSCVNALPTSCPAGATPVADGNGGWNCGICLAQSVSWNYPYYGTCSGMVPQGLQGQTVTITGTGSGQLSGMARYQCFANTWTEISGSCSPPSSPPTSPEGGDTE